MLKPIPNLTGYFADSDGDIYSLVESKNHPKPLIPRKLKNWEWL
jgi:hypothetical protein